MRAIRLPNGRQLAGVVIPRQLFAAILERIDRLRLACVWG